MNIYMLCPHFRATTVYSIFFYVIECNMAFKSSTWLPFDDHSMILLTFSFAFRFVRDWLRPFHHSIYTYSIHIFIRFEVKMQNIILVSFYRHRNLATESMFCTFLSFLISIPHWNICTWQIHKYIARWFWFQPLALSYYPACAPNTLQHMMLSSWLSLRVILWAQLCLSEGVLKAELSEQPSIYIDLAIRFNISPRQIRSFGHRDMNTEIPPTAAVEQTNTHAFI